MSYLNNIVQHLLFTKNAVILPVRNSKSKSSPEMKKRQSSSVFSGVAADDDDDGFR
ncbi:hypothetical protein A2U01_0020233, partial [Trifolium medium]|nr:hypothetical protein [Trifolium medium]